jgi:hypothetical protein
MTYMKVLCTQGTAHKLQALSQMAIGSRRTRERLGTLVSVK